MSKTAIFVNAATVKAPDGTVAYIDSNKKPKTPILHADQATLEGGMIRSQSGRYYDPKTHTLS